MSETVFIVDDDPGVCHALGRLIAGDGFRVMTYPSAEAFLLEANSVREGCIIVDVRLPEMTGPQLQNALQSRAIRLPIIFVSGHADVATAVATLRAGAFTFSRSQSTPIFCSSPSMLHWEDHGSSLLMSSTRNRYAGDSTTSQRASSRS